jgi:signal peptidase II
MLPTNFKKTIINTLIVLVIFSLDRISKIYILKLVELENSLDIYINSYLNLYLIWNKGIAFGLFSFDKDFIYSSLTIIILAILVIILILIFKSNNFKSYCYTIIFGGALGNVFDRIYYSAVPDFIDFHINNFHWFIFNIADIFISIGVICLIYAEVFLDKKTKI